MKSTYLLAVAVLTVLASPTLHAQPGLLWNRTYGGSSDDFGRAVLQTSDGGFIQAGMTNSFSAGEHDIWLIRTNAQGDTLWTRTFGGSERELTYSILETDDGGFLAVGTTFSFGAGEGDVWLIRTDALGDTLWTRIFGGRNEDFGYAIQPTLDGGYVIVGYTYSFGAGGSDVLLIRTDAQGNGLWVKALGGSADDWGFDIQQTVDSGFAVTGYTYSFGAGENDVWLIRTDDQGDTLWTRTFGGRYEDVGRTIQQTRDGGYVIVGYTYSFGAGDDDVWLIRTDAQGDTLWTRTFGGSEWDYGYTVQETSDGGFVIAGETRSFGAVDCSVWLIRTDARGNTLWTRTFGGREWDYGYSVRQTEDGGFVIAASASSVGAGKYDVWLIRLGEGGLPPEPRITGISDVPHDQGRQVDLQWSAGYHDMFGVITQYSIQLQNPAGEYVDRGTLIAHQAESYTYRDSTFGDSTANGLLWSKYRVIAKTPRPAIYYVSPVDSGYSIDNLSP